MPGKLSIIVSSLNKVFKKKRLPFKVIFQADKSSNPYISLLLLARLKLSKMQIPSISFIAVFLTSLAVSSVQGCTTSSVGTCACHVTSGIQTETAFLATTTQTATVNCNGCTDITIEPVFCNCPLITEVITVTSPTLTATDFVCSATP